MNDEIYLVRFQNEGTRVQNILKSYQESPLFNLTYNLFFVSQVTLLFVLEQFTILYTSPSIFMSKIFGMCSKQLKILLNYSNIYSESIKVMSYVGIHKTSKG